MEAITRTKKRNRRKRLKKREARMQTTTPAQTQPVAQHQPLFILPLEDEPSDEAVIMDMGHYFTKAGFAGCDSPRAIFPTVIGRHVSWNPDRPPLLMGMGQKDGYVGDEAYSKCGILKIWRPMENGVVTRWTDVEMIWHHTFYNELRVAPEEHPFVHVESACAPFADKERFASMAFETFEVPLYMPRDSGSLALLATGRRTGLLVDLGESTTITPVYEGRAVTWASKRIPFGGRELDGFLAELFDAKGYQFTTTAEREIVRDIREKLGGVALDPSKLRRKGADPQYEMPCGTMVPVGDEAFRSYEGMFDSTGFGGKGIDLHKQIAETINLFHDLQRGSIDQISNFTEDSLLDALPNEILEIIGHYCQPFRSIIKDLLSNIVLSGGVSKTVGLEQRLKLEMSRLFPSTQVQVISPEWRQYLSYMGGIVVGRLPLSSPMWITRPEYDEVGPSIVHAKSMNYPEDEFLVKPS